MYTGNHKSRFEETTWQVRTNNLTILYIYSRGNHVKWIQDTKEKHHRWKSVEHQQ